MKIAFVFAGSDTFRHLEKVVRHLLGNGHQVTIVVKLEDGTVHRNLTSRALLEAKSEMPALTIEPPIICNDGSRRWLRLSRELINYATYFKPQHPSVGLRGRWKKYLSPRVWRVVGNQLAGKVLATRPVMATMRLPERITPPVPKIGRWLEERRPDVVVACPFILAGSIELEYVKAARSLGIPTAAIVQSWDNLTTKGTFHVTPDLTSVWNQALAKEAVEIHDLPASRVVVTGAPTFDHWFEMKPTLDRDAFSQLSGIDPATPYVVYLCSSRGMIQEETAYVLELAKHMRENPATKDVTLLVRPHPLNMVDWSAVRLDNVRVWPEMGEFTDNRQARQNFYHTLYYCVATVGVNTSAMLEAAIADKPCITIIDERYKSAQGNMGHFRHLLNGDFLEVANSYEQAVSNLAAILDGRDAKRDGRRCFVREFIRPSGMDNPASLIIARVIEFVAQKRKFSRVEIDSPVDMMALR